jgi:hypothetical protein
VRIPFVFSYYGTVYKYVYVTRDGWLTFTKPSTLETRFPPIVGPSLPSIAAPNLAIYALAEHMDPLKKQVQWATIGKRPNRQIAIQWKGVAAAGGHTVTVQIVLSEVGSTIDVGYGDLGGETGNNSVVGIEGPGGADGIKVVSHEPLLQPNTAMRFTTAP